MREPIWTRDHLDIFRNRLVSGDHPTILDAIRWAGKQWNNGKVPDRKCLARAWAKVYEGTPVDCLAPVPNSDTSSHKTLTKERNVEVDLSSDKGCISTRSLDIKTLEGALEVGGVDSKVWDVDRHVINSWEVTGKDADGEFQTYTNWQVKVWLKRKAPEVAAIESLLEQIKQSAPRPAKLRPPKKVKAQRLLELSIVDVHNGLRCSYPVADAKWDMATSRKVLLDTSAKLLDRANVFGPYQEIAVPIGHDWMHIDTANGTTTSGTIQPESAEWHEVFLAGERLAIEWVMALRELAPVRVIIVPGNHDYLSGFSLGRVLYAYFRNDNRVTVDAGPDPYKWIKWGRNLIGLTHKTKAPVRMAALMANERPNAWAATNWREWHLGDQHRTGNAQPVAMEEQGVAIDFLPSIVPGNEWHRRKTLNHQRRAGTVHIWDKEEGPIAKMVCPAVLP